MVDFLRVACWKDHLFQEQHLSRNSAHVVLQLFLWLQDPAALQTKQKCLGNGYCMGKSMVSRVSLPIRSQVAKFTIFTTSLPSCTAKKRPDLPVPCNIDLRGLGRSKLVGFSHRPRRPRLLPGGPAFSTFKELNPPAACRRSAKDLPPPAPRGRQLPWWKVIETDETTWMCPSIELPMATPKSSTLGFSIAIHPFGVQYPCFRKPPRVYRDQILYLLYLIIRIYKRCWIYLRHDDMMMIFTDKI